MLKISGGNIFRILRSFFRQINAPYRLTVTNEESMTEALAIHLTKKSVYIFLSSVLVAIFLLLTCLFLFTPLRFYIPGNSNNIARTELIRIKKIADSLEKLNVQREKYMYNLIQVANGNVAVEMDTSRLTSKQIELANQQNLSKIDHASRYDYLKALRKDTSETELNEDKDSLQKIAN